MTDLEALKTVIKLCPIGGAEFEAALEQVKALVARYEKGGTLHMGEAPRLVL